MKSLRTDDIIGAMPRVRHMPKSLYRQHLNYPYTHSLEETNKLDYSQYYSKLGGKWDRSYNENIYGNFPLSQYDPNPFIKQSPLKIGQKGDSKGFVSLQDKLSMSKYHSKNQFNRELGQKYATEHIRSNDQYIRSNSNSKYRYDEVRGSQSGSRERNYTEIKKKQAPLINYQQIKQLQTIKTNSVQSNKINQYMEHVSKQNQAASKSQSKDYMYNDEPNRSNQRPLNPEYQSIPSKNPLNQPSRSSVEPRAELQRAGQNIKPRSRSSQPGSAKSKQQKERNIFRGIGFNIITNSKYSYNVQTSNPYLTLKKQP